ncbi:MAG: hypothetical protein BMS9Abin03_464 [Thermodesulfobacteriota bacterium]|nr:MAG: hypothetical protein BMS9Abin03_464 [Thermodesulfobacteriota bacterium]
MSITFYMVTVYIVTSRKKMIMGAKAPCVSYNPINRVIPDISIFAIITWHIFCRLNLINAQNKNSKDIGKMKFKKKYGLIGISLALIINMTVFLNSATEIEAASGTKTLIFDHKTARLFRDAGVIEVFHVALPDDVSLLDLNGENVNISDLKGKIAFIHFWATWSTDCLVEMPAMEKLYKRFKHKDFYMAAVNLKEPASRVKQFFNSHRFTYAALLDAKGKIGDQFGIRTIPITIILDKNGRLIGKAQGTRNWDSRPATVLFEHLVN